MADVEEQQLRLVVALDVAPPDAGATAGPTCTDDPPAEDTPAEDAPGRDSPPDVLLERLRAAQDRSAAERDRRVAARDLARAAAYLRVAHEDELTGALQRWPGMVALSRAVNLAHLHGDDLTVAFLDVDGLKAVNDTLGHAAGDAVLGAVGRALAEALRAEDVVLRYGGDEFVCALPGTDLTTARPRIRQVHACLHTAAPAVSVSAGLAQLRRNESAEQVVQRADRDMYRTRRVTGRERRLARRAEPPR